MTSTTAAQRVTPTFTADTTTTVETTTTQAQRLAAAYPHPKKQLEYSISPARQKTHARKLEAEEVFFEHCSTTYKHEYKYYNSMVNDPAASGFKQLRARQDVHRDYVEKDRNLEFGFLCETFFDQCELIEIVEEELERRGKIEKDAFASEGQKIADFFLSGSDEAGLKTQLRECQADEHCERSRIFWQWQKSIRQLQQDQNKQYLVYHHRETLRVNEEKREIFLPTPSAAASSDHHRQQQRSSQDSGNINNNSIPQQNHQEKQSQSQLQTPQLFPAIEEVDVSFIIEYEDKCRQLIERTALQELRSAERALKSFQVDGLNDIAILRLRKEEVLKRSYIIGWAFRFHVLMLQELERATREFVVAVEEKQVRTQVDVVENRCWLRAKETETWRTDREKNFEVEERRKQREQEWRKARLDEEEMKGFIRSELETRIGVSREEHYDRSVILEHHERELGILRRKEIAAQVEQEVSAATLHWTEQFHEQIVVTERQRRRQVLAEEANERNDLLSEEVRDYISTRRDELFDHDTADAMKHIDKVRARDGEINVSTLPVKMSENTMLMSNISYQPHPPVQQQQQQQHDPVISYVRGSSANHSTISMTTGASLRAPKVS